MHKKCDEILTRLEQEGKIKRLDFQFPEKQPLELRLKDMLDNEVDEKYYLSDTQVNRLKTSTYVPNLAISEPTVCELRYDEGIRTFKNNLCGSLRTIDACGNKHIIAIKKDKPICLNSKGGRNGVEGLQPSLKDRVYDSNGIATCCATSNFFMPNYTDGLRIRKLTEKECLKLMGFDDEDYEKIKSIGISRSQIYKQAGNSIVVNVLEAIFKELFREHIADLDKWSDLD